MKKFEWITGVGILLFLVASAMPAYSAKPWPQGGDKGPVIPAGFDALADGTLCTDGATPAQDLFDLAEGHIDELGYTANKNDVKNGTIYPMPITSALVETPFRDQAAMAWDTYHGMFDYGKGKDVTGKIDSVINKFLSNVSYSQDDLGNITIIDGGRITGDNLQEVFDWFSMLRDCVTP